MPPALAVLSYNSPILLSHYIPRVKLDMYVAMVVSRGLYLKLVISLRKKKTHFEISFILNLERRSPSPPLIDLYVHLNGNPGIDQGEIPKLNQLPFQIYLIIFLGFFSSSNCGDAQARISSNKLCKMMCFLKHQSMGQVIKVGGRKTKRNWSLRTYLEDP